MYEGDGSTGAGFGVGVVAVSAYMGGTRGSCVLASACDMLEIGVVRSVGGVYDMCMCLARGGVGGVGGERIGFGLSQFWRNMGKVGYVYVFWLQWCGWCWGRVCGWIGPGRVVLCLCVLSVWIPCVDGGFLRILGAPSVQSCCTLSISAS